MPSGSLIQSVRSGAPTGAATGRSIFNPHRTRVKAYDVTIEPDGEPDVEDESVETFPVTVEDGWIVVHI